MYNEHDRPSVQRMVVTAAGAISAIAAVIAIVAVVFGLTMSHLKNPAPAPAPVVSVQQPATATAQIDQSQPAPSMRVTTAAAASGPTSTPTVAVPPAITNTGLGVVVIDAGHEGSPPPGTEPIGPGSSTMKPKVESGTSGVVTHVDESERNLQIALVLQKVLEARGVRVVMVRTIQDVKISNVQRAQIANNAHAALFIRLHCDSSTDSALTGILTEKPAKDWYPAHPIVARSAVAATLVHKATLVATRAHDRGVRSVGDLTGFNWSQVPSVLVEMGLMSNPDEDRKLATPAYQQQLADGMANGIVAFLKTN